MRTMNKKRGWSKKKKRLVIGGAVLGVLVLIVVASAALRPDPAVEVQTITVEKVPRLVAKVNASGEIKPKEFVELQAEIVGVITELFVQEGDFVQKGDLLVRIDPTQSQADARSQQAVLQGAQLDASNQKAQISLQQTNVQRERANVRAAQAEVNRFRQAAELAANNFRRTQELFEQELVSRDQYEAARNERVAGEAGLATAEARLEQAEAALAVSEVVLEQAENSHQSALRRVEQFRAQLDRAEDSLAKTTIRSPLTGVITSLNVEVGERAVPGTLNNPAATIMVIADLSVIEAEVEVDETDIVRVQLGQQAEVLVDALPDQPLAGTVTEIGNSAIVKSGSTQEAKDFKVAVRLEDPPQSLRPGLSCTADITTATRQDVPTIPIQALVVREYAVDPEGHLIREDPEREAAEEDEDAPKPERKDFEGVFVVKEGKAEFVAVKTGISGDTELEVVSGVGAGAEIVSGSYKALRELKDGDRVEVAKEDRSS